MSRLAVNAHEIGRVLSGQQAFILRPALSSFYHVWPGDALWLAEPFYLAARWRRFSPTAARDLGATPVFAADHPDGAPEGYGKRHPARSLCREWHRFHVRITARALVAVTAIDAADLAVLGFDGRVAFEDYFSVSSGLTGYVCGTGYRQVLRLGIEVVRRPLPDHARTPVRPHLTWAQKHALAEALASEAAA